MHAERSWNMELKEHEKLYLELLNYKYRKNNKFLNISQFRLNTLTFRKLVSTNLNLKKIIFLNCWHYQFIDPVPPTQFDVNIC